MATQTLSPLPARKHRTNIIPYLLIAPPVILITTLIFFPAAQSFAVSLVNSADDNGISLARYGRFFNDPIAMSNLVFTIRVTIWSVAGLFLLCFPLAIYLRFSRSRIANWVQSIALIPVFVPGIILSYALIRFLRPRGMLHAILNTLGVIGYTTPYLKMEGIIIGLIWEGIPFTLLVLIAGLRQVDNALIESAQDVGASNWQIFWRIILPLVKRPVLIVFCLNFIGIFGSYTIPYLLGPAAPQTMGVYMQRTFQEFKQPEDAQAQAVITFIVCLIVGLIYVHTVVQQRAGRNT
jgi:ABC-type spermidine/putrescine transport system permease subunit I